MSRRATFATALVGLSLLPLVALAQSSEADTRAAIRARLMADPRSSQMSQAEFDATVDALASQAAQEGLTGDQIAPTSAAPATIAEPTDTCGQMPSFLCAINRAFGFDGSYPIVPAALVLLAGLLGFLLYELKRHVHIHGHVPLQ